MQPNSKTETLRDRLQNYLTGECNEGLLASLLRAIEDPLKPRSTNGSFRLNPILLLLLMLATFSIGTCLYFTYGGL